MGADLHFALARQHADHFRKSGHFSATLKKNRDAVLDFREEALRYMRRMRGKRSLLSNQLIGRLSSDLVFSQHSRIFVAIAAHCSEREIDRTLLSYGREADAKDVEIVLLINGTRGDRSAFHFFARDCRRIRGQIASVMSRRPNLKVHVLEACFSTRQPIGSIKGILADAIVQAALRANIKDPVIVFNDADQLATSTGYLRKIGNAFRRQRSLDLVAGPVYYGYGPKGESYMPKGPLAPELFLRAKCLSVIREALLPEFLTLGNNFAVRLSAYCAAGGFDPRAKIKEDFRLGFNVKAIRRNPREAPVTDRRHQRFLPGVHVVTDPRRLLAAILGEVPEWPSWKSFHRFYGSSWRSEKLLKRYAKKQIFLQKSDMSSEMSSPISDRGGRVVQRIKNLFFEILGKNAPSLLHRRKIHSIARRLGLELKNAQFDLMGFCHDAEIDLKKSEILRSLNDWARSA